MTFPELSLIEETSNAISQPLSEANLASFVAGAPQIHQGAMSLPTIDADSDITASSFRLGGLDHAFISEAVGHSRGLQGYSSMMFEPFFRDCLSIKEETLPQNEQDGAPLLDAYDAGTLVDGLDPSKFTQTSSNGLQSFDVDLHSRLVSDLMTNINYGSTQAPHPLQETSTIPIAMSGLPAPPSTEVPTPQPMFTSNVEYDLQPSYSQDVLEEPLPLPRPVDDGLPDPSTDELSQYRKFSSPMSLPCSDSITLSRSFPLLDGIPPPNSRYSYSNATHGSQAPNAIACDAGLRRHILQNTRCAGICGENASHMSGFPCSRIRKSPFSIW